MAAVNPVPGGQVGGSALAGLAATPTAASAATDRSAPMRRLMKHTIPRRPLRSVARRSQSYGRQGGPESGLTLNFARVSPEPREAAAWDDAQPAMTVLIVDDQADLRRFARRVLEADDCRIRVRGGRKGVSQCATSSTQCCGCDECSACLKAETPTICGRPGLAHLSAAWPATAAADGPTTVSVTAGCSSCG